MKGDQNAPLVIKVYKHDWPKINTENKQIGFLTQYKISHETNI